MHNAARLASPRARHWPSVAGRPAVYSTVKVLARRSSEGEGGGGAIATGKDSGGGLGSLGRKAGALKVGEEFWIMGSRGHWVRVDQGSESTIKVNASSSEHASSMLELCCHRFRSARPPGIAFDTRERGTDISSHRGVGRRGSTGYGGIGGSNSSKVAGEGAEEWQLLGEVSGHIEEGVVNKVWFECIKQAKRVGNGGVMLDSKDKHGEQFVRSDFGIEGSMFGIVVLKHREMGWEVGRGSEKGLEEDFLTSRQHSSPALMELLAHLYGFSTHPPNNT